MKATTHFFCFINRAMCLPIFPLLKHQGLKVRQNTPRLPEAGGPKESDNWQTENVFKLLVIGESTVAGVGVHIYEEALGGQIARHLAIQMNKPVAWRAVGKIGATVRTFLREPLKEERVDEIVLAFGVNDAVKMRTAKKWTRDLDELISKIRSEFGAVPISLAPIPPLGKFPSFPQPLRFVLGMRSAVLTKAAREIKDVTYVESQFEAGESSFSVDRFHPSRSAYSEMGRAIAEKISGRGQSNR